MAITDYFEVSGSGEPIVFIHGSFATTSTWKTMVKALSDRFLCITVKLPGHGGAPAADDFSEPTINTEVDILAQVVEHLQLGAIHLVAHSYGGVVALSAALSGRIPLRALTLYEPVATWIFAVAGKTEAEQAVAKFVAGYRQAVLDEEPYACRRVLDFWGGEGQFDLLPDFIKDGMVPLTEDNLRHWSLCQTLRYSTESLSKLPVPTRIVCGDQSNPLVRQIAQCLKDQLPNSATGEIAGASHFLVTSHTQECLAFVEQQEAALGRG
ncbi:alpha/beta hydrolase [Aestuariicella sp. G3-2]|uniref:alpha/beta fold hydrolase n=1 Tax=Pseudomaricurvus albidus TaxID=2842452 RepID=UPI001C0BEDCF|nr:alpha/beta hydrolase [Aestuariicella albida]